MKNSFISSKIAILLLVSPLSCIAGDWYYRPMPEGPYGQSDGSTYDNAWHRSGDIQWSEMQEGDTLYILGKHFGSNQDRGWGDCTASGITIAGIHPDHPLEQGVITDAHQVLPGEDWSSSVDLPGSYEHDNVAPLYQAIEYDANLGYSFIQRVENLNELGPGKFHLDTITQKAHWMPSNGSVDGKQFLLLSAESGSLISGSDVTVRDMRFIGSPLADYKQAVQLTPTAHNANIQNNFFRFCRSAIGAGVNSNPSPDYVTIQSNTAEDGKIFLYLDTNDDAFKGWTVSDNNIMNMTQTGLVGDNDNEVFYLQGIQDSVFRGNVVDGFLGGAIDFYAISTASGAVAISGNVVEGNVIKNGLYAGNGSQLTGLFVSGDNSQWDSNLVDPYVNNIFRYNVIYNLDANNGNLSYNAAIRLKARRPEYSDKLSWYVYNNVVHNVTNGMYAVEVNEGIEGDSDLYLYNNIFSMTSHGFLHKVSGNPTNWFIDNNVWFGQQEPNSFVLVSESGEITSYDYDTWVDALESRGAHGSGVGEPEQNSMRTSPLFNDADAGDFRLSSSSPAIDNGMNILNVNDQVRDLAGTLVPSGGGTDIGAFEFIPLEIPIPTGLRVIQ